MTFYSIVNPMLLYKKHVMECNKWHIIGLKSYMYVYHGYGCVYYNIHNIGFTSYAVKCHGFAI